MKKLLNFLFTAAVLTSCTNIKQIADLNMISTRNVETKEYVLIKNYQGNPGNKKVLKKSKAKTLDEAINLTVRNTPGGEYMKNVKIYIIERPFSEHYAAEGDVWGLKEGVITYMGFKVGDRVQWSTKKTFQKNVIHKGTVASFKDGEVITVKEDGTETLLNIPFDELDKF